MLVFFDAVEERFDYWTRQGGEFFGEFVWVGCVVLWLVEEFEQRVDVAVWGAKILFVCLVFVEFSCWGFVDNFFWQADVVGEGVNVGFVEVA